MASSMRGIATSTSVWAIRAPAFYLCVQLYAVGEALLRAADEVFVSEKDH